MTEPPAFSRCLRFHGKLDPFVGGSEAQLLLDVRPVSLDRFHTEMQGFGDLPRGLTATEKLQHFEFAIREFVQCGPKFALAPLMARNNSFSLNCGLT